MTTNQSVELPKTYDPTATETDIYALWETGGYFSPQARPHGDPDAGPFVIIMPPPNVTGALHLGHGITDTVEDALIRWHRMLGEETLWVPGLDHAGIATQSVVERELAKEGISRHDLGREEFLERVWAWVHRYRSRIEDQLRRMGCSCDWDRAVFTLDDGPHRAVRQTFFNLYSDGKIYRNERIINWDPQMRTALSDVEVEYEEQQGHLWYVRYPFLDDAGNELDDGVMIATTRPETIPADVAVAVNPKDERWANAVGREVRLPLPGFTRRLPVIADEGVEIDFGTGALKITPGHDPLDFEIGQRHGLETIVAIGWDGAMTEEAGRYVGMDRDACRDKAVEDLEAGGYLIKTEEHLHNVGHSQRSGVVVEPLVSNQWFVDTNEMAAKAAAAVRDGSVRIVPQRSTAVYLQWMDNIRPWCISRQLWWGHRIPAWYCMDCDGGQIIVKLGLQPDGTEPAGTVPELLEQGFTHQQIVGAADEVTIDKGAEPRVLLEDPDPAACEKCGGLLIQDADVLDTWFSSGLWTHSTLGWPDETADLARYYPSSVMETGYDILFFWVARMVMLGLYNMGQPPYETVYLHGIIRDAQGRKMSKSLDNVVDPLEKADEFGMDALRFTLATSSSPGNDMRLTDERLEGGRNFANKIWNGARFVLGEIGAAEAASSNQGRTAGGPAPSTLEDRWILSRLERLVADVDDLLKQFQLGEAGRQINDFLWSEFFDWYVEASKVRLRAGDSTPLPVLAHVLDQGLRLLHPFMPFLTEAVWQHLRPHLHEVDAPALIVAPYPQPGAAPRDQAAERQFGALQDVVRAIRQVRAEYGVEAARWVETYVAPTATSDGALDAISERAEVLETLARVRPLHILAERAEAPDEQVVTSVLERAEVILPLGSLVDFDQERARLSKEIEETDSYLGKVEAKLANDGFRNNAPEDVVAREEERQRELTTKLAGLRDRLASIS